MSGRCNLVTTIQIAKRQLGMADADYRAMLERVTGKASSTGLRLVEKRAVIKEMERLGFEVQPRKGGRKWRKKENQQPDKRYRDDQSATGNPFPRLTDWLKITGNCCLVIAHDVRTTPASSCQCNVT